ncbi:MAG: hypothetical protein ACI9FR_003410 [Cryomorphaceae bacterium]
MDIVDTYMALNEPELAWSEVERMLASGYGLTPWNLQQDLVSRYHFGESPEYQALTKNLIIVAPLELRSNHYVQAD